MLHDMCHQGDPADRTRQLLSEEILKGFMEVAALTEPHPFAPPQHTHLGMEQLGAWDWMSDTFLALY